MGRAQQLLVFEAVAEAICALLLLMFPRGAGRVLGIPADAVGIWPRYVGALVAGLSIATWIELAGWTDKGLGLAGHAAINLTMAFVLVSHLAIGPELPTVRAKLLLWFAGLMLAGLGLVEIGFL